LEESRALIQLSPGTQDQLFRWLACLWSRPRRPGGPMRKGSVWASGGGGAP